MMARLTDDSTDGHLVSFDIPRVALQKTKYVVDNGLGGLMWWAVDEDWVEAQPQQPPAKRHLDRKHKKGKRSCKRTGTGAGSASGIGFVHAAEPTLANGTDSSTQIGASATSASKSNALDTSSAGPSESNGTAQTSTALSASVSASASISPSPSNSAVPDPHGTSTSEAEGELDGIQLNIGRSLAQVAKEGFERYAQGLDTTWNVLGYPTSGECCCASRPEHV